ncbi:MAG: hypothetical protein L3J09_00465 [Flavobacteriaceae bacterium]|nr:hypothetical protein [Flavobacteriaceae bacterium]
MKYSILLILILSSFVTHSQDIIVKVNGDAIEAKVNEVGTKFIKYHKFSNLKGSVFNLKIIDVAEIQYEDGTVKIYSEVIDNSESLEEVKSIILEYFNTYTYWENSNDKKKYKAVFEEDYIRLIVMNKSNTKGDKGILYDFSKVYKFGKIDKREDDIAFLNIWVSILKKEKKNSWEKHKLVVRVKGHENATTLYKSLKQYSKLVLEKKRNARRNKKK